MFIKTTQNGTAFLILEKVSNELRMPVNMVYCIFYSNCAVTVFVLQCKLSNTYLLVISVYVYNIFK